MDPNVVRAPEPSRITAEEAVRRLSQGEDLYFVDTRNPVAWAKADTKLPEAVRVPADQVVEHLADMPRDRTIITYCT